MLEFIANYKPDKRKVEELVELIRLSHKNPDFHISVPGLIESKSIRLAALLLDRELVSFAWTMTRSWLVERKVCLGCSIGLVTTKDTFRGNGFASLLLSHIEVAARDEGMKFLYLQGIPDFYTSLGYSGFAWKRKYRFNVNWFPKVSGKLRSASISDIKTIDELYSDYALQSDCPVRRDKRLWKELIGPLSKTFLFYNPRLVLDESSKVLAYFTVAPSDTYSVREFIPVTDPALTERALAIVAAYIGEQGIDNFEIFAPYSGPIHIVSRLSTGADFYSFIRPKASNMIKWLTSSAQPNNIEESFIQQGDNL